ncbi:putative barnase/colicin E5 family endoribonuclease, partial [Helicobacter pylori]|uniref:putative barnase/colicin E5 family endoribonuclease n=1 Tax=Helicobacter pylori TaxID=210 RepID=UPI002928DA56
LETKKGFVAGAFHKEGLGDIDLVWGTPKTKDSNGYGLVHILERRISNEMKKGLSEKEAKEYALNIVKSIPEVLQKGSKGTDHLGRVFVDYGNKRVGLNNEWKNEKLENHWVISSYELYDTEKQALRSTPQAITKEKAFNSLNSVEPNPTINALKTQEPLSEQVELSLKGIVRILEVLLSLDFFKNANEIDSSLRNSIEWLSNAGESLKAKMKEYEGFFSDFNTSMKANEQEVTSVLNAN